MDVDSQHRAPSTLCTGKEVRYPLNRDLGGSQSRSECFGESENVLLLLGIEP